MKSFLAKSKSPKLFCIGLNKTGTTTIETDLKKFGYKMGNQVKGELLLEAWYKRDFKTIVKFCKTAEAFQDIPFSLPFTYMFLEQYFPKAKFILTVRDNPEQWYESLTKFHSKLWGNGVDVLSIDNLKDVEYRYKGYAYEANRAMFTTPENDPYSKEVLIEYYNNHIYNVSEYFRSRPEKLLVINVSIKNDYFRLCKFLGQEALGDNFSWENQT